jgi:hypothetical protein
VAETPQGLTVILGRAWAGDQQARGELIALIYDAQRGGGRTRGAEDMTAQTAATAGV